MGGWVEKRNREKGSKKREGRRNREREETREKPRKRQKKERKIERPWNERRRSGGPFCLEERPPRECSHTQLADAAVFQLS